MKILIYGINYAPELTGIGKYTGEMASWLANKGHEVHVVAAMPYYPEWRIHDAYKGRLWFTEIVDGVRVHRSPLYVPAMVDAKKRILHEFSFLLATMPGWLRRIFAQKFDLVFTVAPPFHLNLLSVLYKKLRGGALVNHVQDLQVDAAKDLGMIKNRRFLKLMFGMERWLMMQSSRVSTISAGMQHKILAKGIPMEKMLFFPNWVDSGFIYPLPKERSLLTTFGYDSSHKIVLYSGNLGEKQGLDMIIRVAAAFKNEPDVQFAVCGQGGGKDKLVELAAASGTNNLRFFPLQPYGQLAALLAMADVHLVLQKSNAADLVMPSKLTGILAAGGCSVITALPGTSLYDTVHQHDMGILVPPEDDAALAQGIRKGLYEENNSIRLNARKYAEEYLDKENILSKFEAAMIALATNV
ncbi:MAG: WcaI family glycosyltransferase [Edaphocola sp.]